MSTEMWEAISRGDGPFQYDSDGFMVRVEKMRISKVKWSDIRRIVAYRNEYFAHDEIGIEVFADNDIKFAIPELTPGCLKFYRKLKENIKLSNDKWFADISTGKNSEIIYQRL